MKKLLPVFLALSLAANAALLIRSFAPFPLSATPAATPRAQKNTARPASGAADAGNPAPLPDKAELASLQAKLASLGLAPDIAHDILRSLLWKPLRDRRRAMMDAKTAGKPYWRQSGSVDKRFTAGERAELRALSAQIEARAAALLGDESARKAAGRYSFLPPEKAAALGKLHRDYSDIQDGLADETSLFRVPSDGNPHRLLREEQRRDLEGILSPAELAEYDLRHSSAASELRRHFSALPDSTEAEYKAVYDIAQKLSSSKNDPASQAAAAQQLRELLGPDRYASFLRGTHGDYIALQGAAARFDIPESVVNNVFDMRNQAARLSQQIASDKSLSSHDKQTALQSLANQLRSDVRDSLGNEIGGAYLGNNMTWLNSLSNGNVVSVSPTGKLSTKPLPGGRKKGK